MKFFAVGASNPCHIIDFLIGFGANFDVQSFGIVQFNFLSENIPSSKLVIQ